MLYYIKLLAFSLMIINTWLLNSVLSDRIRRYKRTLAQRADRELALLAGEQCSSPRHPRGAALSLSAAQHHPLAAHPRRHTRRRDLYQLTGVSLGETCLGVCGSSDMNSNSNPLGLRRGSHWGTEGNKGALERDLEKMSLMSGQKEKRSAHTAVGSNGPPPPHHPDSNTNPNPTSPAAGDTRDRYSEKPGGETGEHSKSQRRLSSSSSPRSTLRRRLPRSPGPGPRDGDSWEAFPDSVVDSQRAISRLQQQQSGSAPEGEYSSGEQEGPPSPARGPSAWGARLPDVPPRWMSALYFSGEREQLRVNPVAGVDLPRVGFSIELWVKPEGGQANPAVIAGVFDNCSHSLSEKGWSVGIRTLEPGGRKDARFFFALRTDRAQQSSTIYAHHHYHPDTWTHLVATYDGRRMSLYLDGAKVGESSQQSGNLHSPFMQTCRTLLLGGDLSDHGHSFRGHVGGVALWPRARPHEDLRQGPPPPPHLDPARDAPVLARWGDFSDVERQWLPRKDGLHPSVVVVPVPEAELVSPFLPPPCGFTACDNTDVVLGYNHYWPLRSEKRVRYRLVNICNDDGGLPTVSQAQVRLQHRSLVEAFRPYNITLELEVLAVRNSSLRQRFVLSNCQISKIGNRHCDPECDHPRTGHDGGDCLRLGPCYNWRRQDGVCNSECNSIHYDYDDGDCCDPEVTDVLKTCFDPESPDRAYMSIKELKELLHLSSADTLNVFFANNSAREELAGAATWPWAKEALSHLGGMVLNPSYYGVVGHNNTMIHEMGHIFGLYHVFKGVSERESCDDPCQETSPSLETGDLCADTAPTPKSKACHDPGEVNDSCGSTLYRNTPFNNYMSYTDDNCTNHFTPNQVARMHCYIDLVYQDWLRDRRPAPIPLAPMVIGQSSDSVSIHWLPPVRGPLHQSFPPVEGVSCGDCERLGVLRQYAYEATSPRVCDTSGYWTPEEAIGPPDVYQPCEPSLQAWSPELSLYDANVTSPCPDTEGCVLTLRFLHAVVPHTLTVWVTYISADTQTIANIQLVTEGGASLDLGPQHVFCDAPLTVRVHTDQKVSAIKLCTFDEKMEIDAILLTSGPHNPLCSGCRPLSYRVARQPPLPRPDPPGRTQLTFTDSDVEQGARYQYRVQVEEEGVLSDPSPALFYTHGTPFCGDGQIHGAEECDDGNLLDGDGCSKKCLMEAGFNCVGEPSLCYVFEGDGVCEEFERGGSSVRDCGYFTPQGYRDQWASAAWASHQDLRRCPAQAATGEPSLSQLCKSQYLEMSTKQSHDTWTPCTAQSYAQTYYEQDQPVWLKVGFARPGVAASVIIYLASDGTWPGEQCRKTVSLQLSDTTGRNHSLGSYDLSCQQNPLVVNVTHNLSQPFFLTSAVILSFSSPYVAVTGVALRTSCHFSAFALTGCLRRPCQKDSCSPPQLAHASVSCTPVADTPTHCSVSCHRGYSLSILSGLGHPPYERETELECVHGSWDRVVSCQPIDCGPPDQSHVYFAMFSCPWGTTFGKQCSFSCNPPAILQGDSDRLVCLEDGLWSFPEAYCKIECPEPPAVANAKLLVPQCEGTSHDVGAACRYRCNPGYYVNGSLAKNARKRFVRVECLEGGQWEEGGCEPISCPPLPAVFKGMYTCTKGLHYDSLCTLQCPDASENHTIRCTKEGEWTEQLTMCRRLEGSCPAPPDLNSVEYTCDEGYDVGAVCYPTCIVALDMDLRDPVVLANRTTAETLRHWTLPSKVQTIVCTGMMRWHPDPKTIHCIQSCEPFGGDGWCDTINNRAYCQYDGGDCCPSTLSTRKVIQFGADCDQDECSCRDPNAEENKSKAKLLELGHF